MAALILFMLAGLTAGLVSGLFGMGGGLAVVPMLVVALSLLGIEPTYMMHLAVGTSLALIVPTSIYTTLLRGRSGDLDRDLVRRLAPPVALGAGLGSIVGDLAPGLALRGLFMAFLVYMMVRLIRRRMALGTKTETPPEARSVAAPPPLQIWSYGGIAGIFGALLGIGVAAVMTPFLIRCGYHIRTASALAAMLAIVVGLAAGTGYMLGGLNEPGLPAWSAGYVYLPALGGLFLGALAGSPLGIRLSHSLSENLQIALFLAYLAVALIVMATR